MTEAAEIVNCRWCGAQIYEGDDPQPVVTCEHKVVAKYHVEREHVLHTCTDDDCRICRGGLASCDVCGGGEGSLLPTCPGVPLTGDALEQVYAHKIKTCWDLKEEHVGRLTPRGPRVVSPMNEVRIDFPIPVVTAMILRSHEGVVQMLLQQRPAHVEFPYMWCCPGGKVERGETDLVALRREIREEHGLDIQVTQKAVLTVSFHPPTVKRSCTLVTYPATVIDDVHERGTWKAGVRAQIGDGVLGLGWFTRDVAARLPGTPSLRLLLNLHGDTLSRFPHEFGLEH